MPDPGLAAFGSGNESMELVPQVVRSKIPKDKPTGKYQDFFNALRGSTTAEISTIDQQTGLEFENIEGEVMGEVLTASLTIGSSYNQIDDSFFCFESPDEIMNKIFAKKFLDAIQQTPYIFPGLKEKLNGLMISWKRQGRQEMVQVAQALSISLQESEKNDKFSDMMKKR